MPSMHWVQKIVWDTDGIKAEDLGLPSEGRMRGSPERFSDRLSDRLSERFGWCVISLETLPIDSALPPVDRDRAGRLSLLVDQES
jgi:hypothetical protein